MSCLGSMTRACDDTPSSDITHVFRQPSARSYLLPTNRHPPRRVPRSLCICDHHVNEPACLATTVCRRCSLWPLVLSLGWVAGSDGSGGPLQGATHGGPETPSQVEEMLLPKCMSSCKSACRGPTDKSFKSHMPVPARPRSPSYGTPSSSLRTRRIDYQAQRSPRGSTARRFGSPCSIPDQMKQSRLLAKLDSLLPTPPSYRQVNIVQEATNSCLRTGSPTATCDPGQSLPSWAYPIRREHMQA